MNFCWYVSLGLQVILLGKLAIWRVPLPWFTGAMAFSLIRTVGLLLVRRQFEGPDAYRIAWGISEPLAILLLLMAGLEVIRKPSGWAVLFSAALYGSALTFFPDSPITGMIWLRAIAVGSVVAAIVALSTRWRWHATIFACYGVCDLIQNAGILMGAVGESRPAQFLIFGQTVCLAMWVLFVPEVRKECK